MSTFVTVDDFTGTDQRRIEQAIAAITPAGGTIIFPKRTYTIEYVTLKSHMSIIGNGSTITTNSNLNEPLISIESGATNITISGLTFNGNKAVQHGNRAGAIYCYNNQDVKISNCVFNDLIRAAISINECNRVYVHHVKFNGLGRSSAPIRLGVSLAITDSKNIVVEDAATVDNYGEGVLAENCQGVILRKHTYTTSSPSFATAHNAITFTICTDFVVEDIEASYMQQVGVEINGSSRFKLSNLNVHHNGLYNLLISPFTQLGEILNTYGEVSNVASQDSASPIGINIIGSQHISFNNIKDNKRTRFAMPGTEGLELVNVEVKDSSFNVVELSSRAKG